jgi:peptidoglycan hydrolase-like protein with peptidoglycan-binding domain
MISRNKMVAKVIFTFLLTGMLGLSLSSLASAVDPSEEKPVVFNHQDIKKIQESLIDKGYDTGKVDGILGPRTREGIRQYQKSEKLPVTGNLDVETAGKLGVGPDSAGGSFKGAGHELAEGGKEFGHEMSEGKPIAATKEMGKGIGRAGEKVGEGVADTFSPESDRGDREKKEQAESQDKP